MVLAPRSAKPLAHHHKKRAAGHHKRTRPYEKTYWPYLPLLAIVGLATLVNLAWPLYGASAGHVLGSGQGITSLQLLTTHNQERQAAGAAGLHTSRVLSAAAQAKAQDMASRDYWSHTGPDGRQAGDFARQAGYRYRSLGENLAFGFTTAEAVTAGWRQSPEHRTNLLDPAFTEVGYGIVQAADYQHSGPQTIVVALYGTQVGATPTVAQAIPTGIQPASSLNRLDTVAGGQLAPLSGWLIVLAGLAAGLFIVRHTRYLRRLAMESERFIIKHPHLDVAFVSVCALAVVLTRANGFIH